MKKRLGTIKYVLIWSLAFLLNISVYAQDISVTGLITDKASGEPLPGVSIMEKGTYNGVVTNFEGKYSIKVKEGASLVFSYMGYDDMEEAVAGRSVINIVMVEKALDLDEVVVIGYGVQKKSDKTGAVANVTSEELNKGVLTDPIQGLQGKTAGVSITKKGGDPNAGFSVKIRGSSGFASNTDPLYVVDGVPGVDPTTIAPEDIESYNVLKDASSTAIYGARGANGVVIITTKRGNFKEDNTIDLNVYTSFDQVAKRLDFLSGDDMRAYSKENGLNLVDGGANTDWQDEMYRTGHSKSYNLSASGGSESANYRASVTHSDFEGVVLGSSKQRSIGRLNLTQKALNGKLTLQANMSGTFEQNEYIQYSGNGPKDVFYQMFQRNPTDPVYNTDGSFYELQRDFQYNNPVALVNQIQNERDAKRLLGNLKADLEIIKGLKAGVNLGYTRNDSESTYFEPSDVIGGNDTGYGKRGYENFQSKLMELTLSYDSKILEDHNISLIGGYSYQQDDYDGFSAQGKEPYSDFAGADNLQLLGNTKDDPIASYRGRNRLISTFGRLVYNYKSRYYLTATYRVDGSNKFGKNKEWGKFPSTSIKWKISEEDFLKGIDWLSMLSLRAGYGLSGNQEIGSYNDVKIYRYSKKDINPETGEEDILIEQSHNGNPNLQWEENRELNIGVDFAFLKNRISGSAEYYNKRTDNLIYPYAVPMPPNPVNTTWANAGEIENKGYELNIQAFIMDKRNFKWKSNFSFSKNMQKVISLDGNGYEWQDGDKKKGYLSGRGLVGVWTQWLDEGQEVGTWYMPEFAGFSVDGKFLYKTPAGGVSRTYDDKYRRVVGQALPDFEIGWTNNFTLYQNFDFGISLRAVYGHDIYNMTRMIFSNPDIMPTNNVLREALDLKAAGFDDLPTANSYYLEDGSFLKIDNITLGYNFNTSKIPWAKKLRVYFATNNFWTFTNYTGLDPEVSYNGLEFGIDQYNTYPKSRTFTFGLNVKF